MYTFDHTSFHDFKCYLRYRDCRHDKLLAAKEAALAHGNLNLAQRLEPLIEQAFQDLLNIKIPDYNQYRPTVEYLEPDINDPLNQSYKQTTHPLDNQIPLLNSHYTSINLDDITLKTLFKTETEEKLAQVHPSNILSPFLPLHLALQDYRSA